MILYKRKPEIFKNIFFKVLDFLIIFLKINKKNNNLSNRNRVVWIAETGSRDFIPRVSQAISLWKEFNIPSIIIHKHFLKKLDKNILKNSVVIDKSATVNCVRRLRYSKLNGAYNLVIPEELLICDNSKSVIEGSLHPKTLNYVDLVLSNSGEVIKYLKIKDSDIKYADAINPRLCTSQIYKNCKDFLLKKEKIKKYFKNNFILINDKLSLKFSSYENEIDLLRKDIFKSTAINSNDYIEQFLRSEEIEENLLITLIKKIRENELFNDLKIVLRPHPAVDLGKYKNYFKEKLDDSLDYIIIREDSAIEWMKYANIIFHSNCTSAIEGYYAGLNNIFNFADSFREGTSNDFLKILNPLGIEKSILYAKNYYQNNDFNEIKKRAKMQISNNNLYQYLGERMKQINKKSDSYCRQFVKFEKAEIRDLSALERWSDAQKRIQLLKKNQIKFKKYNIKTIGNIGVQVGTGFC